MSFICRPLKPRLTSSWIMGASTIRERWIGRHKNWHIARGAYRRCFTRRDLLELFSREFEALEMIKENGGRHGFWHDLFGRR